MNGCLKSPERSTQPCPQIWDKSRINQLPSKKIKQLIQKKTLIKDQEACKDILKKIVDEKGIEILEKNWFIANRDNIRSKFLSQHEQNIELEELAGIRKHYIEVEDLVRNQQLKHQQLESKKLTEVYNSIQKA